jgi:hypothetical protein
MKTAHIKTVDGTTIMMNIPNELEFLGFRNFLCGTAELIDYYVWVENNETCFIYRDHIISVRFREV